MSGNYVHEHITVDSIAARLEYFCKRNHLNNLFVYHHQWWEFVTERFPPLTSSRTKTHHCGNKLVDHYHRDLRHVPPRLFLDPKELAVTWHWVVTISRVVLCVNIFVNKYIEYNFIIMYLLNIYIEY